MAAQKFKMFSLRVPDKIYSQIEAISNSTGKNVAEVTRELISKGLASDWVDENTTLISSIVRRQLESLLNPKVERLAALICKSGIMSATATFLNVQAFQDLIPQEKKKDPIDMYNKARKRAVEYIKTKEEDVNPKDMV